MLIRIDERPIYVAPEIFNGQKYTSQSDVYAWAVCMYAIYTMSNPYDINKFPTPWSIAEFVSKGNRLPQPDDMPNTLYEIIQKQTKEQFLYNRNAYFKNAVDGQRS